MIWVKRFAGGKNAEYDMNEFAHSSADDLHFVFAVTGQTLTEAAHDRVVSLGSHSW